MDATTTPGPFELLSIALDLTASLSAADRSSRLVEAVRRVLPCDAAVLLRVEVARQDADPWIGGRRYRALRRLTQGLLRLDTGT